MRSHLSFGAIPDMHPAWRNAATTGYNQVGGNKTLLWQIQTHKRELETAINFVITTGLTITSFNSSNFLFHGLNTKCSRLGMLVARQLQPRTLSFSLSLSTNLVQCSRQRRDVEKQVHNAVLWLLSKQNKRYNTSYTERDIGLVVAANNCNNDIHKQCGTRPISPQLSQAGKKKKKKKRYNALQSKGCNGKHAVGTHTMRKIKHSQVKQSIK